MSSTESSKKGTLLAHPATRASILDQLERLRTVPNIPKDSQSLVVDLQVLAARCRQKTTLESIREMAEEVRRGLS